MNAAVRAASISLPFRTGMGFRGANGLKSLGLTAFPFFGSHIRFTASAIRAEVWFHSNRPRPSTIQRSSRSV